MDSEVIYTSIIFVILISFGGYWFVVFVTKIATSRRYKKATERMFKFDNTDYISKQYNYHYHTEICKYSMFLSINSIEISLAALLYIHLLLEKLPPILDGNNIYKEGLERCASINNSIILDFQLVESSCVLLTVLRSLSELAEMLILVLLTSLMSYLMSRMKKTSHMNIRRYICVVCLIGVFIVVSSYYTFLINLGRLFYLLVFTYNFILFLIYVRRFKQTLLQAAIERLVQYGSNKNEMKQYKYFCYTINCICIGLSFIMVAIYLGIITRIMISFIFFGNCVFPTIFMPQLINLQSINTREISKIFILLYDIDDISSVLACVGILIMYFPLIFITIGIWIRSVAKIIRRDSSLKHRYQVLSNQDVGMY